MESTTHLGLHSQTTRLYEYRPSSRCYRFPGPTGLSPSLACRSKSTSGSTAVDRDSLPLQTTIRPTVSIASWEISDLGLFPLRSPLLRESLLVSFPPLIDMLKFSGWVSLDLRPQIKKATGGPSHALNRRAEVTQTLWLHLTTTQEKSIPSPHTNRTQRAPHTRCNRDRHIAAQRLPTLHPEQVHLAKATRPSAERAPSED